jgi:hypothetical protein
MKFILIFLCFSNSHIFAQVSPSSFYKDLCEYKTDGSGKSMGLKMKFSFPCDWEQANGERPHIVKKFSYAFSEGESIIEAITVNKMPATPSKKEINALFTKEGLKELSDGLGTFISGRKLKIDGLDCGEVTFKATRQHPIGKLYLYCLYYYFIFNDKMIVLSFATGSLEETTTKELFEKYKILFHGLAGNTIFLSKWE